MCLAIPAQLVDVDQDSGSVDLHGSRVHICTLMTPEVKSGDWVLVHAGFALQKLDPEEAARVWAIIREADDAMQAEGEVSDAVP